MRNIVGAIIAFLLPFLVLLSGDLSAKGGVYPHAHWECNVLAGLSGILIYFIIYKWVKPNG